MVVAGKGLLSQAHAFVIYSSIDLHDTDLELFLFLKG